MKTYRFNISNLTYTIDLSVLVLFMGVSLDSLSTFLFVSVHAGTEANTLLNELISLSIWFIPIYLIITNAAFIPFLSSIPRRSLAYTFGFMGISLSMNNFSLLLFNYAFLIDTIGFNTLLIIFVVFGLVLYIYQIKKQQLSRKEILFTTLTLALFLLFLGLIFILFYIITWFT